jgi:gamma-glutamylcysteine synthetase
VVIFFNALTKKLVNDGASQFQKFRVNFHTFHALFSTRLSQIGYAITSFAQDGFNNNENLMEGVKTWLSSMAADFSDTGIQNFIPRYYKCPNSGGDYAEK